jgi:hypothetical protein
MDFRTHQPGLTVLLNMEWECAELHPTSFLEVACDTQLECGANVGVVRVAGTLVSVQWISSTKSMLVLPTNSRELTVDKTTTKVIVGAHTIAF